MTVPRTAAAYLVGELKVPSHVTLLGDEGTTLQPAASAARWIQTATNATTCGIQSLTLDAAGKVAEAVVTISSRTHGLLLGDLRVLSSSEPVPRAGLDTRIGTRDIRVTGCSFTSLQAGVRLGYNPRTITIDRCEFVDWVERAIWVRSTTHQAARDVAITNCQIRPHTTGGNVRQPIQINGEDNAPIIGMKIIGNTVTGVGTDDKDPSLPGTADLISLHRCRSFEVAENVCERGGEVGITVSQQCIGGAVRDNTCRENGSAGISIGSRASRFTRRVEVTGNTCVDNGQDGYDEDRPQTSSGISLANAQEITLSGNKLGGSETSAQQFGIVQRNSTITVGDNTYGAGLLQRTLDLTS